jgi:hypothetical protein
MSSQDYLPQFDNQFNLFAAENIGFDNFPPLQNSYGKIQVTGEVAVLLSAKSGILIQGSPFVH